MKNKGPILPVIIIGGLVLGALAFVVYRSVEKGTPASSTDFFKKPAEVKNEIATIAPQKRADFVKDGNLKLSGEGSEMATWVLLYDEPGQLALSATLILNNRSKCNFGKDEQICSEKHFENGLRVHLEGTKNGNEVTVIKLEELKLPE